MLAASFVFYGYSDWRFLPLLGGSILVNWLATEAFFASGQRALLIVAIAGNLLVLAAFKYLGFLEQILADATGWRPGITRFALPLGISFFTFHHIIYLADLLRGSLRRYGLRDYGLYIALFPQILAGPLVRHSEIVHQFRLAPDRPGWEERVCRGIALFLIGLSKKIFIADRLAAAADPVFAHAATAVPTTGEAWTAALAFPLQIYFDFSGYSDMAIGLALALGFVLPFNFEVPYRATSLREFWRRWHMTLSRFLRDYLYIPLGGNRHGPATQLAALLATMTLGGLWHGAGWNFVIWGTLHGLGLVAGVLWRRSLRPLPSALTWPALLLFLIVSWVFFRASSLHGASAILQAMAGDAAPAPLAHGRTIIVAAMLAIVGPSSQALVARLRPHALLAPLAAVATVLAIMKLGESPAYEFIYFRF